MKTKAIKTLLLLIGLLIFTAVATAAPSDKSDTTVEFSKAVPARNSYKLLQPKDATGPEIYIIQLYDVPLASYKGGVRRLAATSPAVTGEKLNAESPASVAYLGYLDQRRAAAIAQVEQVLSRPLNIAYEYRVTLTGFAAEMTPAEALQLTNLDVIKRVERDREYELHTDAGPAWIGAPGIWDGSATGGLDGTQGENIIVGVIDTGIDPWNPSFLDVGDDGYDHTNPRGQFYGVCDPNNTDPPTGTAPYDPTFPCNDKLIGAWGYDTVNGGTPRDSNGHGSHTASTAAGNFVNNTVVSTPSGDYTANISGVAPHANIIAYAACCTGAALNAAREQVVLDGVDVVNYSIGANAPTSDPWNDSFAVQWLAARDAGIFVATSAGNAGPGDATVGTPADLPWLTTVGASSHNRSFATSITLDDGVNTPVVLDGQAMTGAFGPAEVVFAADFADPENGIDAESARLCADGIFPAGTFSGQIVICERGTYGRVAKGQTVLDGGAGGYVLAQPDEFGGGPGAVATDPHVLPGIHIDYYTYQDLLAYFNNAGGTVMGTIAAATLNVDDAQGDIMASFSSRGPHPGDALSDLIVPNVTAPGRAIWAAYHQGDGGDGDYTFNVIQGTSMSSPHVAGAGALIAALHPDWTPAEIESALMTTSVTDVINDDGTTQATPFAMGSGRIDMAGAAQAGLVLDITTEEFQNADPREGGDPKALNIASFGDDRCVGACSWTRTLESTKAMTVTWTAQVVSPDGIGLTVSPASFELAPAATQVISVTADASGLPVGEWSFGEVWITPDDESIPAAHFPVAIVSAEGDFPSVVEIETNADMGSMTVSDLEAIEITDLTIGTYGLAEATGVNESLGQDATNGDPYDNLNDGTVSSMTVEVPADTMRFVTEIHKSQAPDIDLFIGMDTNADGMPSADEQVCSSTTPSWDEYCNIDSPDAGTWWIVVQNWNGSGAESDDVSWSYAVVPMADAGNMTVTGPASVPPGQLFDLEVHWDQPNMPIGSHWYGAFSVGTDASNPGNLAMINVDLEKLGIPVIGLDPASLEATQPPGASTTHSLMISNDGTGDLDWMITEAAAGGRALEMNLLADGSFEGGSPNASWTEAGSIASPLCDPSCGVSGARTGDWWAWFGGWGTDNWASVSQEVVIPSDTGSAYLSFWIVMGGGDAPDGVFEARVDGTAVVTYTEDDMADFGDYTQVIIDISAYADDAAHTIELYSEEIGDGLINFFVDDVEVVTELATGCDTQTNLPWVSVAPSEGTSPAGSPATVDVTFDATGLENGVYEGLLCVHSNDADNPVVEVPLTLTVDGTPPMIELDPASVSETQPTDWMGYQMVHVGNLGDAHLNWNATTGVPGTEAVQDGGFEAGNPSPNWVTSNNFGVLPVCSPSNCGPDLALAGSWYGWFGGAAGPLTVTAEQTLTIPVGANEISFWALIGAQAGAAGTLEVSIDGNVVASLNETDAPNFGSGYGQVTGDISAYADGGSHTLLFEMNNPGGPNINFFVDEISIELPYDGCKPIDEISWLSMDATSGSVAGHTSQSVMLGFDSAGLAEGVYSENVCIHSNDPEMPLVEYPVTLTVENTYYVYMPVVKRAP